MVSKFYFLSHLSQHPTPEKDFHPFITPITGTTRTGSTSTTCTLKKRDQHVYRDTRQGRLHQLELVLVLRVRF
jgi:hypothetical protein